MIELPEYQCHKKVRAAKIKKIVWEDSYKYKMLFEHIDGSVSVSRDYIDKHQPCAGDYYIVYANGHQSFSPGKAFESEFSQVIDEEQEFLKASGSDIPPIEETLKAFE